ncbi:hypothetical protein P8452_12320 [Trifolium repens]|jgi:hypothetical protein|nr:hypothetical protein QL285_007413 [Trifolium repens]KAK2448148.1 hypothetical protein QL285_007445 [Trifolium repens]WJX23033.1 hypothetical protein P8452_12280 [Trifolium repens]WJX23074.1 hypothetical protein P8452_12320 [Trifolium repens]
MSTLVSNFLWLVVKKFPLGAWNTGFFKSFTTTLGTFVCLDEDTQLGKFYDVARMLIISSLPFIQTRKLEETIDEANVSVTVESESNMDFTLFSENFKLSGYTTSQLEVEAQGSQAYKGGTVVQDSVPLEEVSS